MNTYTERKRKWKMKLWRGCMTEKKNIISPDLKLKLNPKLNLKLTPKILLKLNPALNPKLKPKIIYTPELSLNVKNVMQNFKIK